jgi:hypothetical protein
LNEQLGYLPVQLEGYNINEFASTSGQLRISCYHRATMLQELRSDLGGGIMVKYGELTDMLFHTRSCKSTDPRDKVFAVLGLVDPAIYRVKPDYRITLDQAYKIAARSIITKAQSLDILAASQNPERREGLPSWAPNLNSEWKARPLKTTSRNSPDILDKPDFVFPSDNYSVLKANGRLISTIAGICDDVVMANASTEDLDRLYHNWKIFVQKLQDYPGLTWHGNRDIQELAKDKENDRKWLEFLSLGVENGFFLHFSDDGKLLPEKGSAAAKPYRNPKMVNSLLLPTADDSEAIKVNPYKKFHENLRKYGIGRRLAYLETGCIGLVPGDACIGDELCTFSNTYYPFVLRNVSDENRAVVGDARK